MRSWAIGILACVLASGIATADDPPRAGFAVWAAGLPNGYVVMERQAAAILVTEADVANGAVHVPDGSRLVIATDSPSDYAVDFTTRSAMFRSVQIDGVGRAVELGGAGGTAVSREASAGRRVVTISYRFLLAPDVVPGTYAWPLRMAVRGAAPGELDAARASPRLVTTSGRAVP